MPQTHKIRSKSMNKLVHKYIILQQFNCNYGFFFYFLNFSEKEPQLTNIPSIIYLCVELNNIYQLNYCMTTPRICVLFISRFVIVGYRLYCTRTLYARSPCASHSSSMVKLLLHGRNILFRPNNFNLKLTNYLFYHIYIYKNREKMKW